MNKLFSLHKTLTSMISIVLFTGSVGSCAIFYMIKKYTNRPVYSQERLQEHQANRIRLLQEFNAQPIQFKTTDGLNLAGLLIIRSGATRNLLLCHGYRMAKERLMSFVSMFPRDNILLFDYRAHGESEGNCTTIGYHEKKDVLAAWAVLKDHQATKLLPTYGIGLSMGAVSLLAAAIEEKDSFQGIILDSPFTCLEDQARTRFSKRFKIPFVFVEQLGIRIFEYMMDYSPAQVNALQWAEQLTIPVFVIHSCNDRVASYDGALSLYDKFQTKKEFWKVSDSGHARIYIDCANEYPAKVESFLNSLCA
jgi:uncharacterized protein